MKKILSLILAVMMIATSALAFSACGSKEDNAEKADLTAANSLADLKGLKISAQSGTFHADALEQIEDVKDSEYPTFTDLLVALKSGAIDGYVAEEPTAIEASLSDDTIAYVPLKNNDTGFTATAADVGIAVGLKTGSELRTQINEVLATISADDRAALMEAMIKLSAGEEITDIPLSSEEPAEYVGTLKVGMECAYKPYNWTDIDGASLGAVEIAGEGSEGMYANGYDVQIAKYIANKLGMKLEVYAIEWDSLIPALNSGTVDAIIAGMSPTAERDEEIDFSDTYYESNLVIIYKK